MARGFSAASLQYIEATTPLTAVPATIMCWCRPTAANHAILAVGASAGTTRLQINTSAAGDGIAAQIFTTSGSVAGITVLTPINGTWHHAAGVFASQTSRLTYVDGVAGVESTADRALGAGVDRVTVGARYASGTRGAYFTGDVAEIAIFSTALSAAAIAAIAGRLASPLDFRAAGLLLYAPVWGQGLADPDLIGGLSLAGTAGVRTDHPPVVPSYARGTRLFVFASSALTLVGAVASAAWSVSPGVVSTYVALAASSPATTWAVPTGTLTTSGTITLTGAAAVVTWTVPASTLQTQVALSAATPAVAWAVPTGTLSTEGTVTLTGVSATAAWTAPTGAVATHVALAATSAAALWTVPSGALATRVALAAATPVVTWTVPTSALSVEGTAALGGASAAAVAWTVPAGALSTRVTMTGASAAATWAVPTATLGTVVAMVEASAPGGTWTVPTSALWTILGLSGGAAVAAWSVPQGTLRTGVTLDGVAPLAAWTAPTAPLMVSVTLAGASAGSLWAIPDGVFQAHVALTGPSAASAWIVPTTGALIGPASYDVLRLGPVTVGVAHADTVRTHLS